MAQSRTRTVIAKLVPSEARELAEAISALTCHCEEPKATWQSQRIRQGERNSAWPGQQPLAMFPRPRRERIKVRVKRAA
jgi:hypothetical protein